MLFVNDEVSYNGKKGIVAAISGLGMEEPFYYVCGEDWGDWLFEREVKQYGNKDNID